MNEEEFYYRRSEISDRLSYLMAYAPDFPAEDHRTLSKEREALLALIARIEGDCPDVAKHPRLPLFRVELDAAFEAASARGSNAASLFQVAAERFAETLRPPAKAPDFIAGSSGVIKA